MNIKIVADSACDLPVELLKEADIDIFRISLNDGVNDYEDGINLLPEEMYKKMKEQDVVYKTSQVSFAKYVEKYTYYAQNNIPMLSLVMSSGLSSSHNTSALAIQSVKEKYPYAQIYSVDSKLCSMAHGYAAYLLSKSAQKGHSIDELLELLDFLQKNTVSTASLDDLKYVARGGRLPNVAAMIANTLHIKPFLHADDGYLHMFDKVRGTKKIYKKYVDIIHERNETTDLKKSNILIEKSDDMQMMLTLRDTIKEEFSLSDDNFILGTIGSTIGAHIGPGSMCMFFLKNPIPDKYFLAI